MSEGRRHRLRTVWSEEELKEIYPAPHQHAKWGPSHTSRVKITAGLADVLAPIDSVGDMSCGDGWIAEHIAANGVLHLGDYAEGWAFTGPMEETLTVMPHVDLYICSETIEHLDDPDPVLKQIREKANKLLLSTPHACWGDTNKEHYWAWDRDAVGSMLRTAGWDPVAFTLAEFRDYPYDYQIWACR